MVDPFCGSGSTLIAARRCGRDAVGYDLDPAYVALAQERLAAEAPVDGDRPGEVAGEGASAAALAREAIETAGFSEVRPNARLRGIGLVVSFSARDAGGAAVVLRRGGSELGVPGRHGALGDGVARAGSGPRHGGPGVLAPLVVLTTQLPRPGTEGDRALRAAGPGAVFDAVDLASPSARAAPDGLCTRAVRRAPAGVLARGGRGAGLRVRR